MRARPLLAALLGPGLAVTALQFVAVGTADSAAAATSDTTLVSGTVVDAGQPVSGAPVVVDLWPDHTPADEGAEVPVLRVGQAVTADDGTFSVAVDPAVVPAAYRTADGAINFVVTSVAAGHMVSWDAAVTTADTAARAGLTPRLADGRPAALARTSTGASQRVGAWVATEARQRQGATAAVTVRLNLTGTAAVKVPAKAARKALRSAAISRSSAVTASSPTADTADGAVTAMAACIPRTIGSAGHGMETFAQVFATSYAKGRVDQESASSHTLGVGVSTSGAYGTYSASGSQTKSAGFGYDSGWTIANAVVKDDWAYKKYGTYCTGAGYVDYTIRPDYGLGGPYYDYAGTASWCAYSTPYPAGHDFWRSSGANRTYSAGMGIQGVGLTAQSGWTSSQKISFHFSRAGKMCASTTAGLGYAPMVRSQA